MQDQTLFAYALRCLTRRDYAVAELRHKLAQKSTVSAQVESILQRLLAEHLLDDARFAENYTRMRIARGYGPLKIQQELQQRGIALPLIAATLAKQKETWQMQLKRIIEKKFGDHLPKTPQERAQKMRFLHYRGFSTSHINTAINDDDEC